MIPREMMSLIARRKLVAEVRVDTATQALSVVDALAAGGIGAFEIAWTIPGASEILTHYATRTDIIVGAGAVLEGPQAADAISSGARFIASPICAPDVAQVCVEKNTACVLGALTPTEIIAAQRAGAEMVKLFPAEALGGPMYVRALFRQLSHMSLQISGGFTAENMAEYLALPIRTLALGTLLVPRMLVDRGNWQAITNRARAFVEFAANPHANAVRFLAMMGVAPRPAPAPSPAPVPVPEPQMPVANIPTMPVPPNAIAAALQSQPPISPSASNSGFKPWDSRPVELGDDEDWLR